MNFAATGRSLLIAHLEALKELLLANDFFTERWKDEARRALEAPAFAETCPALPYARMGRAELIARCARLRALVEEALRWTEPETEQLQEWQRVVRAEIEAQHA